MTDALTHMNWRPALIQLTQMPRADVDDGKSGPIFVEAESVVAITRQAIMNTTADGTKIRGNANATMLSMRNGSAHFVTESTTEVARLINAAFGHEVASKAEVFTMVNSPPPVRFECNTPGIMMDEARFQTTLGRRVFPHPIFGADDDGGDE